MNLTIVCPHFAPDLAPTGEVMTSIAEGWVREGHRLHVVTALPWYVRHDIEPGWEGSLVRHEDVPWGRITRVHPFPTDKTNIPARALAFGGFTVLSGLMAAVGRSKPDAVLAMSPPLTLGLAGWLVARARRVPFVFNIQDVFPDVAIEAGVLKGRRAIEAAYRMERFTYARSDAVTVLSDDLRDNVVRKLPNDQAGKVHVIPNFIDTGRIQPGDRENDYRREFGLEGKTVVMYAGNLGFSQPVELLLDAAAALADDPSVVFVVNGGGSARETLVDRAKGLDNVVFVDLQPKDRLAEVLAAADIHVVLLRSGLAKASVPSKLYSILAAARPLVASVDPGTEVATTVQQAGAGLSVPPGDAEALTKAIRRLIEQPAEARAMGVSGRAFVEQWPSPFEVAARYADLFASLADRR